MPRRQFKQQPGAAPGRWRLLIRVAILLLLVAVALRDWLLLLIHGAAIVALAMGLLFLLLSSHSEIQVDPTYLRRISFLGALRRSARRRTVPVGAASPVMSAAAIGAWPAKRPPLPPWLAQNRARPRRAKSVIHPT